MTEIIELVKHLENGKQADPDGVMVTVSRHAVTEAVRLLRLLGETEEALAACQSQAGGEINRLCRERDGWKADALTMTINAADWKKKAEQLQDAVNRIAATGHTISEAVELLESRADEDDPCPDCGMRPTFDGMWHKQGCQSLATSTQSIVTVHPSAAEREIARMIKDHASIISNKGKACVFCGAIGGEHHLSTCRAEGDKSDGANSTAVASEKGIGNG